MIMLKQYCIGCGKKLNSKMVARRCNICHNRYFGFKKRKPKSKCIDCGKTVSRRDVKRCMSCYAKYMVIHPPTPNGIGSGSNHPSWKGGKTKDGRGHIYIKSPNHPFKNARGYVYEHRLIMEKRLGRYLRKNEIVHHKNGKEDDNRIENLELTNQSEHIKLHNSN